MPDPFLRSFLGGSHLSWSELPQAALPLELQAVHTLLRMALCRLQEKPRLGKKPAAYCDTFFLVTKYLGAAGPDLWAVTASQRKPVYTRSP